MKAFWKNNPALRIVLMIVLFVLSIALVVAGWKMTGQLAGLGIMLLGVALLLAVLAICLTPFITMAVQYLLYKLAAFLAGTVTQEPLADLIDALGSAFGLMLGMTGSCALALLISIISSVSVVST